MIACLICKSLKVNKEFDFQMSITSFSTPINMPAKVYLCENCGHIFSPPSQVSDTFYEEEYNLLLEGKESEFVVFEDGKENTLFDRVLRFVFQSVELSKLDSSFKILEVGAGKGILLKKIREFISRPISISAVEPNKKSEPYLRENLPGQEISMTTLENSPFKDKIFNLILSHGVLEHVSDPVEFLKNIRSCMDSQSLLYIGVPNFVANPADLITTDHLSKFTPQTIESLFNIVGLEVLSSHASNNAVFMTYLLRKGLKRKDYNYNFLGNATIDSRKVLNSSLDYIDTSLKAFDIAAKECARTNKDFSIYGAGNIALLAIKHFKIKESGIKYIYDDNRTFWETSRIGITIKNPQELALHKDSIIFISANTCYQKEITKRINALTDNQASIYPKVN